LKRSINNKEKILTVMRLGIVAPFRLHKAPIISIRSDFYWLILFGLERIRFQIRKVNLIVQREKIDYINKITIQLRTWNS